MAPPKRHLRLIPADPAAFRSRYLMAEMDEPDLTLDALLRELPAVSLDPLPPALAQLKVTSLDLDCVPYPPGTPVYLPPALTLADFTGAQLPAQPVDGRPGPEDATGPAVGEGPATESAADEHPEDLTERQAVVIAYSADIEEVAAIVERGFSVLVRCEKLLVEHLARDIVIRSGRPNATVRVPQASASSQAQSMIGSNRRTELMNALESAVTHWTPGDVVVIPQLDLLAGGTDASLSPETREVTDLLYEHSDRVILAFADLSLVIPEVLANRFAVRKDMNILPREVLTADGEPVPVGRALVTRREAELFTGFDPVVLYKHVAGMSAVRLRHGMMYAYYQHHDDGPRTFAELLTELRFFKATHTSSAFEVPEVRRDRIGGYEDVKAEVDRALAIINKAAAAEHGVPEHLRHDLIPGGYIFYGPPGTGKTLFAKMIATELDATILVVSGPEITDMYVGESERKLRGLFAEARRNAPSVLVFDEFDSIAGKRSGRDDGGSRAGNAIVAQLLTELDGFRPEVPVLIIGTTNRIDIIDEALMRPSRFYPIKIGLPGLEARRAIAKVQADYFGVEVSDEVLDKIAVATDEMNGDEIRSIFRDARSDELVGGRGKPDARHLGQIVGKLQRSRQQRDMERAPAADRRHAARDRRDRVRDRRPLGGPGGDAGAADDGSDGGETPQ